MLTHLRLCLPLPSNLQTNPLACGLGGLHDHQRLTNDRRSFLGQNAGAQGHKQVPNQEVPPQSETWETTVCTISDHPLTSRHVERPQSKRPTQLGPYRMFSRHSVPIQLVGNAASLPTPTFDIVYRSTNHHVNPILTDCLRIPARACQNHVSTFEDTPTSPTSKLSAKSITNALYK
ncbi:unnamed protein product [Prunus armeniaca]